jgi:hypothetical protein
MEIKTTAIVEAAGRIIQESGINSLSIEKLAGVMKTDPCLLKTCVSDNDEILLILLQSLDNEIKRMRSNALSGSSSPSDELQLLFESLYKFFNENPHYLTIIFSTETGNKNTGTEAVLSAIKTEIRSYLSQLIKRGKKDKVFRNKQTVRFLVNNILGSFRMFMNEQWIIKKMVKELEILKNEK